MFGKFWRDPVVSAVVGGLILSGVTASGTYFLGYWSVLKEFFVDFYTYLVSPSNVPIWWVGLSSIVTILVFGFVLYLFLQNKKETRTVSWKGYKYDNFWGVEWHWTYFGNSIERINPLCPNCKYQLISEPSYTNYEKTTYKCEDCGYCTDVSGHSESDVKRKVNLKIQQKVRTGKWYETN
ncbi:putative TFIIB-type zinc ribbon-containing protein [Vibrio crassostreae]|uniref:hypothetical protein n=1 Tax=Vibrio crassostreae TaxID=246167 RepID=UPI0006322002|nr:hypothetical protein [Vibrio crassostreae]CAK2051384.1 putative TFIIB-type zinc ribbon-containing protein [Vibrio crassostreae]CAK2055487.1 putative TFIIB-type zinc ribbon-containing protein [Vibrio crassostreae]CAK2058012.1 putative TFIIB-type zinc ribbon-containing protein [Vibrio crassostreae]CAK2061348.1 putative TFIIB-type zinc ribbon-containing protein [Vibrio crassostreae]CAK2062312.1 putative TFIIB-type zinc ribbon-containing protein [Vibrio crassostreae]